MAKICPHANLDLNRSVCVDYTALNTYQTANSKRTLFQKYFFGFGGLQNRYIYKKYDFHFLPHHINFSILRSFEKIKVLATNVISLIETSTSKSMKCPSILPTRVRYHRIPPIVLYSMIIKSSPYILLIRNSKLWKT